MPVSSLYTLRKTLGTFTEISYRLNQISLNLIFLDSLKILLEDKYTKPIEEIDAIEKEKIKTLKNTSDLIFDLNHIDIQNMQNDSELSFSMAESVQEETNRLRSYYPHISEEYTEYIRDKIFQGKLQEVLKHIQNKINFIIIYIIPNIDIKNGNDYKLQGVINEITTMTEVTAFLLRPVLRVELNLTLTE